MLSFSSAPDLKCWTFYLINIYMEILNGIYGVCQRMFGLIYVLKNISKSNGERNSLTCKEWKTCVPILERFRI